MMGFERSDDYRPLFWISGRPVHATALLVFLHLAALLLCSMFHRMPIRYMWLSSDMLFRHWALWQPATYAFAHVLIDLSDSIWFLLEMVFLFIWGREVERYFGTKTFLLLYGAMLLTAPAVLVITNALGWGNPYFHRSDLLHFGMFVAFATIYPNVEFFGSIASRWVVIAILVVFSAALFSRGAYFELLVLLSTSTVAFYGVRYASVGGEAFGPLGNLGRYLPRKQPRRDAAATRATPRRAVDTYRAPEPGGPSRTSGGGVHDSIDPLLEKISKHGLASLTHSEKATLERARVSLLRKEREG